MNASTTHQENAAMSTSEKVSDVVEHVLSMSEKYGFQPDEDMVREAVAQSAELLAVSLSDAEIVEACGQVMSGR